MNEDVGGKSEKNIRKIAEVYHDKYGGCAQAAFAAVADSLNLDYGEDTFEAMVGLSGGVGRLGTGTCGAVNGAAAAISLSCGIGKKDLEKDSDLKEEAYV